MDEVGVLKRTAIISEDGLYRYELTRRWADLDLFHERLALFIMLNPSTADADIDDPTIRRCISFAKREGCDGLRVVNLYAYRATNPADLWTADDPVGPNNDYWIRLAVALANREGCPIIAAWGAHAKPHRVFAAKSIPGMEHAQALAHTKSGAPGHPLYIKGNAELRPLVSA